MPKGQLKNPKDWWMTDDELRQRIRKARETWGMHKTIAREADIPVMKLRMFSHGACSLTPPKRERLTTVFALIEAGKLKFEIGWRGKKGKSIKNIPRFGVVFKDEQPVAKVAPLAHVQGIIQGLKRAGV